MTRAAASAKKTFSPSFRYSTLFWLGLLGVSLAAILWRANYLHSFPLSPDEGIHLMWLRLLGAGYEPYREVYITYPPLYPLAIETVWHLWPTETAQRWFSVVYTLFGAVGVALIARKFAGTIAGLTAAALTLFSPVLLEPSRAILGEFPSVAWSVWAIFFAWLYRDPPQPQPGLASKIGRRLWLILSGLCLAFSLLTKLLTPFMAILIPLMLLINRQPQEQLQDLADNRTVPAKPQPFSLLKSGLIDLTLWGLALLLPILILLSIYDIGPLFGQVVDQRLKARDVYTAGEAFWPPRYERAAMFFQEDTALVILALIGLTVAWQRRLKGTWIMVAWLGLAVAMLAIHNPIRYKHFLIFIPPLAILGGVTIEALASGIRSNFFGSGKKSESTDPNRKGKLLVVGGLILLGALYLWQIPTTLELLQAKADVPQPPQDELEALAFIRQVTAPDDCLISDDMPLLYWSGRMTPPELAEVSSNRLYSGALTLEELIAISDAYDCQLVAAVSNRIPKYLPEYMAWVKSKYLGRFHYGEDDLYFAKIDTDPQPATPLWANFDDKIVFHGYTLPASPVSAGSESPLTLVWQAQTAPETDYAIFVQVRDAANNTLASADHQPYLGLAPTSIWPAGAVIQEVTWLHLPPDLPAGPYNIYVGLYHPDTLARLPLLQDKSGENALILGPVVVQ